MGTITKKNFRQYLETTRFEDDKKNELSQLVKALNPTEILTVARNYIAFIDFEGKYRQVQYDYSEHKWYYYEEKGFSSNPEEVFVKWVS